MAAESAQRTGSGPGSAAAVAMLVYVRTLWLRFFRLDEERIEAIINDILEASLNSKAKLKAIQSLYYLSFVPENREVMANCLCDILQQVKSTQVKQRIQLRTRPE